MVGSLGKNKNFDLNIMLGKIKNWFLVDWRYNLIFIFILIMFVFLGSWRLPYSPATWFDEGINLGIVKSLIKTGMYTLPVGPDSFVSERPFLITTNYPVLIPVAVFIKLFGFSLTAARLPMVIFLALFLAVAYKLVRRLGAKEFAMAGLALIVSFAPFYGNGKAVLGEVPGLFYFLAGLLVLPQEYKLKKIFLAGILFGLSATTKPFFLILIPAVVLGEIYGYWKNKKELLYRLICLGAGLVLPLLIWLKIILPDLSFSELASIVSYYSNSYASQEFGSLVLSNILRFFTEKTPLHFFLLFIAITVAGLIRLKKKEKLKEVEIILYVFVLINLFWYFKTPGWYRYFFSAHLLILILAPYSLNYLINRKTVLFLATILFIIQSTYLITKKSDPLYYSDGAVKIANYLQKNSGVEDSLLLVNVPSLGFLVEDRPVYQYLQINPILYFGDKTVKDNQGNFYDYIITSGGLDGVDIKDLPEILKTKYKIENQFGSYMLYQLVL